MRIIGLDIHRAFAEAVAWDDGKLKRLGRVDMRRHLLTAFAKKLSKEDVVIVEATGNASSVAAVIAPHVKRVVVAEPEAGAHQFTHMRRSRPIRSTPACSPNFTQAGFSARKSGYLDEPTPALRPAGDPAQSDRPAAGSRLKNIIQSILQQPL